MAHSADVLVAGGGGFIGGHLVADLVRQGRRVRSVDVKPLDEWHQVHPEVENVVADLSRREYAQEAMDPDTLEYVWSLRAGYYYPDELAAWHEAAAEAGKHESPARN